jgi:hypothetical protein
MLIRATAGETKIQRMHQKRAEGNFVDPVPMGMPPEFPNTTGSPGE